MSELDLSSFFKKTTVVLEEESGLQRIFTDFEEQRYSELQFIAEGGQKSVYKAFDNLTGREVAIAFNMKEGNKELFLRECRISSYLQHPYILPIYDLGVWEDGRYYYSMKLIEGTTLSEKLKDSSFVDAQTVKQKVDLFIKICEAIEYAHSKGVLHLDIKPSNVGLNRFGEVSVLDWGLARILSTSCDAERSILDDEYLMKSEIHISNTDKNRGTEGYMAPELSLKTEHSVDVRADIYSLSVLFYKLIFGQSYKEGDEEKIIGSVAISIEAILKKGLAKNVDDRYESVGLLLRDLRAFQEGFATNAEEASRRRKAALFFNRHIKAVSLFCIIVLLFSFGLSVLLYQKSRQNTLLLANEKALESALAKYEGEKSEKNLLLKSSSDSAEIEQALFNDWSYEKVQDLYSKALESDPQFKLNPGVQGIIDLADRKVLKALESYQNHKGSIYLEQAQRYARFAMKMACSLKLSFVY